MPILLTVCGFTLGCGTDPTSSDIVEYEFSTYATVTDSTADRVRSSDCVINGTFHVARSESSGTIQFPLHVSRSLFERRGTHLEQTSADTVISDAVLHYEGLGSDSLVFTFGAGAYTVTRNSEPPLVSGQYQGHWSCGPDAPLAQDSTLGAYGYDTSQAIPGIWRVSIVPPIG
jgi:hypothetical protein